MENETTTPMDTNTALMLYFFAAIKVLGSNNNLTFTIPDDLPLPLDGRLVFGVNTVGSVATITIIEGVEAIEAIQHANNGDTSTEPVVVREERNGEDAHRPDVSESSTD